MYIVLHLFAFFWGFPRGTKAIRRLIVLVIPNITDTILLAKQTSQFIVVVMILLGSLESRCGRAGVLRLQEL